MREKLNENPVAQVVLVGVLVVVGVFFFINSSRGGEEGEEAPASEVATTVRRPSQRLQPEREARSNR